MEESPESKVVFFFLLFEKTNKLVGVKNLILGIDSKLPAGNQ